MTGVPATVLAAFGVDPAGPAQERLSGGQGTSVAAGGLVFKPDSDPDEIGWLAHACTTIHQQGFRLPAPVASDDGRLVVDGWSATEYVAGRSVARHDRSATAWLPVLAAGRALHQALGDAGRPVWIDGRTHKWALADRSAWDGDPLPPDADAAAFVGGLHPLVVDEELSAQSVHGDLSGNVLLAPGLPPAIIDVSVYWRPAAFADAVVVVDALLWWQADPPLVRLARPPALDARTWRSLLARALLFRRLAFVPASVPPAAAAAELERYRVVAELVRGWTDGALTR